MAKKVLITGGAGFIGTSFAKNLAAKGLGVRLFDLDFTNHNILCEKLGDFPNTEKIQGSILDSNAICNAARGCNYVVHLAAMLGVRRTEMCRTECLNINILGTINVLEACLKEKIEKILFSSSSEIYGEIEGLPVKEESPKNPVSIYAITKLAGEEYIRAYADRYGLKYSIIRFFNVYGPGQVAEFVMPRFIKRVLNNNPPVIYGDGSQIRSFCFVEDAVEGAAKALLTNDNEVFNIGSDKEPISMKDLASKVIKISGKKIEPEFIPMSKSDRQSSREIKRRIPCIDKARVLLGYEPRFSLDDGIKKIMETNSIIETWFENL